MASSSSRPISESLKGYGRSIVGGLLFAFAPLYTMEIWWQGFIVSPPVLLFSLVMTYVVLVAYAHYAGLHDGNTLTDNLVEAFESILLALGVMSYFNFRGSSRLEGGCVYAGGPLGDAFVTYAVGLVVSAVLLWSVGRFGGVGLGASIKMIVYLAWPATLGASVGRLIL